MNKKEIKKILEEWWSDEKTCSGKPHCSINECDLCTTCFLELCNKFGLKIEMSDFVEK